jgi:23S rRNA (guanosine2251-2'-O)-methyltransferase
MAGNSQRKGAMRNPGSKKGPTVGSGGQRRRGLEPKKPTPKAVEREKHPAAKRAKAAEKRGSAPAGKSFARSGPARTSQRASSARPTAGGQRPAVRSSARPETNEQVYGRNSVVEALRATVPATALHVQADLALDDRIREALEMAVARKIPVMEMTRFELDRMTSRGVHQGLSLTVPPYKYADPIDMLRTAGDSKVASLFIALDGITDPRNLGAVVRSAAAFGAKGVLIPERRAAGMTASAWKTSAGAASRVPVARITNMSRTLIAFRDVGATVLGLAADGPTTIAGLDPRTLEGSVVLVVGSEGEGLGRLVARTCDLLVSIPISASTESLNAGVAASIALYEVDRLRRSPTS